MVERLCLDTFNNLTLLQHLANDDISHVWLMARVTANCRTISLLPRAPEKRRAAVLNQPIRIRGAGWYSLQAADTRGNISWAAAGAPLHCAHVESGDPWPSQQPDKSNRTAAAGAFITSQTDISTIWWATTKSLSSYLVTIFRDHRS